MAVTPFQHGCGSCTTETYELSVLNRMRNHEKKRRLSRVSLFYSDTLVYYIYKAT